MTGTGLTTMLSGKELTKEERILLALGKMEPPPQEYKEQAKVVIKGLTIKANHKTVLDNLHLTMFMNEIFVLVGPNGCGKSTLAHTMAGMNHVKHGKIIFDGENILHDVALNHDLIGYSP